MANNNSSCFTFPNNINCAGTKAMPITIDISEFNDPPTLDWKRYNTRLYTIIFLQDKTEKILWFYYNVPGSNISKGTNLINYTPPSEGGIYSINIYDQEGTSIPYDFIQSLDIRDVNIDDFLYLFGNINCTI